MKLKAQVVNKKTFDNIDIVYVYSKHSQVNAYMYNNTVLFYIIYAQKHSHTYMRIYTNSQFMKNNIDWYLW